MANTRLKKLLFGVFALISMFSVYKYIQYANEIASQAQWRQSSRPWAGEAAAQVERMSQQYTTSNNITYVTQPKDQLLRAAMVALVRNSELDGMRATVRQVDDRFNRRFGYPYIFLNDEDFSEEFMKGMREITDAPIYFGKLPADHWGLSEYVNETKVHEMLAYNKGRYIYGGSYSYRLMCRYQSGFIHKHPLLANLDYYWRIEPGVTYFCDMPYDPFKYMKDNNLVYGFTITPMEKALTVETLWETTRKWMLENPQHLPEESFIKWAVNDKSEYTLCHFWSNFEIVDLSFYRSKAYESYFQHLDRAGGFFYERWGDAPVHSIAAAMLLRKEQLHWFEDVGYHHPGYTHCPNDSSMASRCVCSRSDSYMYRSVCNHRLSSLGNINKQQALELAGLPDKK